MKPENWPKEIEYLTALTYSKSVTSHLHRGLQTLSVNCSPILDNQLLRMPSPLVCITPIKDRSHPAHGQHGLHATRDLPPSSFIILYLGCVHTSLATDAKYDPDSDYDLSLDRELGLAVDATHEGNEARFINDYRGVRVSGPNAEFKDCWVSSGANGKLEKRIGVFVVSAGKAGKRRKGIKASEEIVVSYGKGFWNGRRGEQAEEAG
ncbi:hypothetical protein LTR66_005507 [Elasticomyces elasticus]|nr:hypothetical protein LTR66_005507 [Elasticomyces elasticus]